MKNIENATPKIGRVRWIDWINERMMEVLDDRETKRDTFRDETVDRVFEVPG